MGIMVSSQSNISAIMGAWLLPTFSGCGKKHYTPQYKLAMFFLIILVHTLGAPGATNGNNIIIAIAEMLTAQYRTV